MLFARMRQADRLWLAQLLLAALAALLMTGSALAGQSGHLGQFVALCRQGVQELLADTGLVLLLVPAALAGLSLFLTGLSVWRQLRATRRVLAGLGPLQALPPELELLGESLGLAGRLRLVDDVRPLAFCAGLIQPVVWVTVGLVAALAQNELAAVLRHERHHLRHRDPFKLLVVRTLADAFFFLPLVRELGRAYELHKELAADADAAAVRAGKVALARALFKLLPPQPYRVGEGVTGPLLSGQQDRSLEARLSQLTGSAAPSLRLRGPGILVTALALLLFLGLALSSSIQPVEASWGERCGPEAAPVIPWPELP